MTPYDNHLWCSLNFEPFWLISPPRSIGHLMHKHWQIWASGSWTCHFNSLGNVCSTRGTCQDDDIARAQNERHGNGSCLCQEPFFGLNCEFGGCPAGFEYVQLEQWTCQPCREGWYKRSLGNSVTCQPCQANRFMPDVGSVSCHFCKDIWLRVQVNKEKTACARSVVNVLVLPLVLVLATGFFVMLPYVSGLPLQVRDVRRGEEGVMVTTKVRHWMLSGKRRRMYMRHGSFPKCDKSCRVNMCPDSFFIFGAVAAMFSFDALVGLFCLPQLHETWNCAHSP